MNKMDYLNFIIHFWITAVEDFILAVVIILVYSGIG
jgi:uncharacterized membrane protein